EALLEIAAWGDVEFAYDASVRAAETISTPWDEALIQAVVRHQKGKTEATDAPRFEVPPPKPERLPKKRGFFAALRRE
ncbi:MAG TPA: hypothetical protein VGH00_06435, partial [Chthoniobacterales bacterium]